MKRMLLAAAALVSVGLFGMASPPSTTGNPTTPEATTMRGRIDQVRALQNEIVLKDDKGNEITFHLGSDAVIQLNGRDTRLNDLKQGDEVTVRYIRMVRDVSSEGRGTRGLEGKTFWGTLVSMQRDQNQLMVKGHDGKEWTFHYGRDTSFRVNGRESMFGGLKAGDKMEICYQESGNTMQATNVCSLRPEQGGWAVHGQIEKVSAADHQFVLKDAGGMERTFQLGKGARIRIAGQEKQLADLKLGDQVGVDYQLVAHTIQSQRNQ